MTLSRPGDVERLTRLALTATNAVGTATTVFRGELYLDGALAPAGSDSSGTAGSGELQPGDDSADKVFNVPYDVLVQDG
jgi:hypothetical protein